MKIKGDNGYRFIKEFGGAINRQTISATAQFLADHKLLVGRVLDYGCGFGFDATHFGWDKYDPYYFQNKPSGLYDTIICNHVANILTRSSREKMLLAIQDLLTPAGKAYVSVSRKIPKRGKLAIRKRIQNYVVLNLESVFCDGDLEIYRMVKGQEFEDSTLEIEARL